MFNFQPLEKDIGELNLLYLINHKAHKKECCIYCGNQFKETLQEKKTRDHVIPKERLRELNATREFRMILSHVLIAPCCFYCNQLKGHKSMSEFKEYLISNWVKNRMLILSHLKNLMA